MTCENEETYYNLPDYAGAVITHAPIGIILTDAQGIVRQANPKAAQLCGAPSPDALIGQHANAGKADPDLQAPMNFMELMKGGVPVTTRDSRRTPFGAELHCDCTFIPLQNEDGHPKGMLMLLLDVRNRLMLERSLFQAEKLAALDKIVGGVAHELNNPLTAILGYTEMLLADNPDSETRRRLARVNEEAQRCRKITESLHAFAQRSPMPITEMVINDVIEEIVSLSEYQLRLDEIRIELDLDDKVPSIPFQQVEMQRVILNIIVNAHRALTEVERPKRVLRISSELTGKAIRLSFVDNGCGMNEEVLRRAFDPFFSTRPQGYGIGLGLSTAYGIVREHSGKIWADSTEGEGTALMIELPVDSKGPEAVPANWT